MVILAAANGLDAFSNSPAISTSWGLAADLKLDRLPYYMSTLR